MKEVQKTMYQCEHCFKWFHRKHNAANHENVCNKNLDNNRPCFDCENLEYRKIDIYEFKYTGDEDIVTRDVLFCKELDCCLYPPKIAKLYGHGYDVVDFENIEMQKICEKYNKTKSLI